MTDNPLFLEEGSLNHLKDPVGFAAKPINEKGLLQLYPEHFQPHKTRHDLRLSAKKCHGHASSALAQQIQPGDQDVERMLLKLSTNPGFTASNF